MSVVATRVYESHIEIASDSQVTSGMTMQNLDSVKLFSNELGVTVGACGSMQEIALFKIFLSSRTPRSASEDDIVYFMHEFHRWLDDNAEQDFDAEMNQYHMVFGGSAFSIQGYYVREITDFDAIGAGTDYALAALYLGKTPLQAVNVACDLNIFCSLPTNNLIIPRFE